MKSKFVKSLTSAILVAAMTMSLAACGKKDDKTTENNGEGITLSTVNTAISPQFSSSGGYPEDIYDDDFLSREDYVDPTTPEALEVQAEFDKFIDERFNSAVTSDSLTFHYSIAHPETYGIDAPEPTLGEVDFSEEALEEDRKDIENTYDNLLSFDYNMLTGEQRFLFDILCNEYTLMLDNIKYTFLYEPFAYTSGFQSNYPITMSEYKFFTADDIDTYLELLKQSPDYTSKYLEFEDVRIEKGYFMNSNSASEVIRQCEEFIASPEENLLIVTFDDRIDEADFLSDDQKKAYKESNKEIVLNDIIPMYQNIIDYFTENKDKGVNENGLCYFDEGKDYYRYRLKSDVGTDKSPEEIIEMLDAAIAEKTAEVTSLAMTNYTACQEYYNDYNNLYEDIDPKETIINFQDLFSDQMPSIPEIDFTVEPVHSSLEGIVSPAFYMTPALDEYTKNSIYINNGSSSENSLWSTLAHEGIPGHMYQFVYYLSTDPEPLRYIMNFNGYTEGWATYVELMSYNYYNYSNPVYADLATYDAELNLLVMGRIEIGINYEGWTVEDTSNWLNENGYNGGAAQEIFDYVVAEPVNYQMYITGWLQFEELKSFAEAKLRENFDPVEFHKVILDAGPCPFSLLKTKVEDYVRHNYN